MQSGAKRHLLIYHLYKGPHITALGKKFHLEHFTCSVCPTVFKQNDQYYERNGQVYCKTHYSILFAQKCGGCKTAVLKNFVEMSRHNEIEQWHPECYMVYKVSEIPYYTHPLLFPLPFSIIPHEQN
jgi:hypothetical protein